MRKILLLSLASLGCASVYAQTYCVPVFDDGCDDGDQINSFTIPSATFNHQNTACSTDAYGDYTAQSITLQAGVSYSYSITHGYETQKVKIWIDLNNDGTFIDAAPELIAENSSTGFGSNAVTNGNILIPATATPGTYRMRVGDRYSSNPEPCNTDGYGEAHDYTVVVTAPPSCFGPVALTSSAVTVTSATIAWSPPTTAPANGYLYYYSTTNTPPAATVTGTATTATTADLTALLPSTAYYYWVKSVCTTTDQSPWVGGSSFTTSSFCPDVTSPSDGATGQSLTPTITWDAVTSATGYKLTVGTTAGGTDVLNNVDLGNVLTYTFATPLAYSTEYYFTVNAYSPTITASLNCEEWSFTTICSSTATVPNYTYDFGSFPNSCWSQASDGNATTGPTGTDEFWYDRDFLNSSSNTNSAAFNLYYQDQIGWLKTIPFNLTGGGYKVKFDYGITEYFDTVASPMGSDDTVQFLASQDGGTTWTVLQTWNANNAPSNVSTTYSLDLTGYTSANTVFAFLASDGAVNDSEDYEFFVDNFAVESVNLSTSENVSAKNKLTAYPNPFADVLNISDMKNVKSVSVVDVAGRVVKSIEKPSSSLQLGELKSGMYMVILNMNDGSKQTIKAIKK